MQPSVSVCVPVFRSEGTLGECLESVAAQTFRDFEVVVVDDASDGFAVGKGGLFGRKIGAKKIVRGFAKSAKRSGIHTEYIRHSSNLGLLEARRTLVGAARGEFVAMVDSDDALPPDALEILVGEARRTGADIVHGKAEVFTTTPPADGDGRRLAESRRKAERIAGKILLGGEIRRGWLVEKSHTSFLWGKLIRRSVYADALGLVPFMRCTMAEDAAQYFFITTLARIYAPIPKTVYRYRTDSGITSNRAITSIDGWERVAQAAEPYKAIFGSLADGSAALDGEEREALAAMCRSHLANNVVQMTLVDGALRERARQILADHWGENFVKAAEAELLARGVLKS